MPLDPFVRAASWPRLAVLAALAALVVVSLIVAASLADAALLAGADGGDGPLLAPFRWSTLAANLA